MATLPKQQKTLFLPLNCRTRGDCILMFVVDFLAIHPFGDANGRIACVLTDLLLINEGLPAIFFFRIRDKDLPRLYAAVELSCERRTLEPLNQVIASYEQSAAAGVAQD